MLSVMIRHLNSLNYFGPNLSRFGWDFTDSDNYEGQRSNVLKYPSNYLTQPPVNLFTMNSIEVKSVQSALSDLLTTSATHGTFSRPSTKRGLILIGLELNTNARESFEHCRSY